MLTEKQALKILFFVFVMCLVVLSLTCKKQQEPTNEQDFQDQPQRVLGKYFKAVEEKDFETAISYFSAKSLPRLSTPKSKQTFYDFANQVQYVEYLVLDQKVKGDTATVVISGFMHMTDGDKEPVDNEVYDFVKEDGEWKIELSTNNSE
jgi:uncharacterized protein YchJ